MLLNSQIKYINYIFTIIVLILKCLCNFQKLRRPPFVSPRHRQVFREIKAILQWWRGIKQPITSFSTSSPHYIQTTDTDTQIHTHTHTLTHTHTHTHSDWMGPIIQPVQKGSSVRFIQVFVSVYVFVWMDCFVLTSERKHKPTAVLRNYRPQECDTFSS